MQFPSSISHEDIQNLSTEQCLDEYINMCSEANVMLNEFLCSFPGWTGTSSWSFPETHIPCTKTPSSNQTGQHSSRLHLRCSLFCRGKFITSSGLMVCLLALSSTLNCSKTAPWFGFDIVLRNISLKNSGWHRATGRFAFKRSSCDWRIIAD